MINTLTLHAYSHSSAWLVTAPQRAQNMVRVNKAVFIIAIAIAVVLALGLATAWFIYCRRQGAWPALDMPSFRNGGTWKVYCRR